MVGALVQSFLRKFYGRLLHFFVWVKANYVFCIIQICFSKYFALAFVKLSSLCTRIFVPCPLPFELVRGWRITITPASIFIRIGFQKKISSLIQMLFVGSFAYSIFISMRVNKNRLVPAFIVLPLCPNLRHENIALRRRHHHFGNRPLIHGVKF